jgi:putative transposase
MGQRRKKHSDEFKAKVALEAVKGVKTLSELSSAFHVHPTVIGNWRRQLISGVPMIFDRGSGRGVRSEEEVTAPLYEEIGRLKMEIDWLKKKS